MASIRFLSLSLSLSLLPRLVPRVEPFCVAANGSKRHCQSVDVKFKIYPRQRRLCGVEG